MDWYTGMVAIVLLTAGLIGQGFEMRKIQKSIPDGDTAPGIFMDRRNFKWYAMIGAGVLLWYVSERGL